MWPQPGDLLAGKADGALIGRDEPGDGVEQCRFARPVGPDHGDDRMRRDAQLDRLQGDQTAKPHGKIDDFEKRQPGAIVSRRQIGEAAARGLHRLLVEAQGPRPPGGRDQPLAAVEHHQHQDQPEYQLDRRGELDMLQPIDADEAAQRVQPLREVFEKPRL